MSEGQGEVTLLLQAWKGGRSEAFDQLIPLVYNELSRIAHGHLRRSQRTPTLDTGVLVNEAYLKLAAQEGLDARDRGHFLAVAARAMRQVLIDLARARQAEKRGAGEVAVTLNEEVVALDDHAERLLDLDRALTRLREVNERLAQIVECRHFAGLSEEETAEALGVSLRTVQRDWMRARAWLRTALLEGPGGAEPGDA